MNLFKNSFRLTKEEAPSEPALPLWQATLYVLATIVVVLCFTLFLIIRREGNIEIPSALDWVLWIAFAGAGIYLFSKMNRRITRK